MNVKFPRGLIIDLDNIPENFEAEIQKAFAEYTEGTNPAYMYQDKLAFIDRMCQLAKGDIEDENGNITVYVSNVDRESGSPKLLGVESEEEWNRIKDVLRELSKDSQ